MCVSTLIVATMTNFDDTINVSSGDPNGKESKVLYRNTFSSSKQYMILCRLSIFSCGLKFSDSSLLLHDIITKDRVMVKLILISFFSMFFNITH